MDENNNLNIENNLPSSNQKRLNVFISKYKNTLLIVAIFIVTSACIGIVISDNSRWGDKSSTAKKQNSEVVAIKTQNAGDNGVRIDDPDNPGEYIIYHYDGTLESSANPGSDTFTGPKEDGYTEPGLTANQAADLAMKNPGTVYEYQTSGGTPLKIISDGTKTYSPDAYKMAYPPTTAPIMVTDAPKNTASSNPPTQNNTDSGSESTPPKGLSISQAQYEATKKPGATFCDGTGQWCYIFNGVNTYDAKVYEAAVKNPKVQQCDKNGDNCLISADGKVYYPEEYKALNELGQPQCDKTNTYCYVSPDGKNLYTVEEYKKKYPNGLTGTTPGTNAIPTIASSYRPGYTNTTGVPRPSLNPSGFTSPPNPTAYPSGFDSPPDSKKIVPVPAGFTSAAVGPNETITNISVATVGVGSNTAAGQNANPIRPQFMSVQVLSNDDQVVKEGIIPLSATNLNGTTGFGELLSLGSLPAGNYKTRVRLDNTLWKTINTNFTPGTKTTIPTIDLTPGDIDQDNSITLQDYNLLLSCFRQNSCDRKLQADLNLDGKINEVDLNILYSTFSKRLGE